MPVVTCKHSNNSSSLLLKQDAYLTTDLISTSQISDNGVIKGIWDLVCVVFLRQVNQLVGVWRWKRRLELSLHPAAGFHCRTYCSTTAPAGTQLLLTVLTTCCTQAVKSSM